MDSEGHVISFLKKQALDEMHKASIVKGGRRLDIPKPGLIARL